MRFFLLHYFHFFVFFFFFFQAEDGIRDHCVTGVQTCALPISASCGAPRSRAGRASAGSGPEPRSCRCRGGGIRTRRSDRKSTRLNSSHTVTSYAVFCLKKKTRGSTPPRGRRETPPGATTAAWP